MNWYVVKSPSGKKQLISAETKFAAIAKMVENEGHKYSNSSYKAIKSKL